MDPINEERLKLQQVKLFNLINLRTKEYQHMNRPHVEHEYTDIQRTMKLKEVTFLRKRYERVTEQLEALHTTRESVNT